MRIQLFGLCCMLASCFLGVLVAHGATVLDTSRDSTVAIISQAGNSKGSGFMIDDEHVLTCFHVVAALSVQGTTVNFNIYQDLQVVLPSGETISGTVVTVPTTNDPTPVLQDFALVKLKNKPAKTFTKVQFASEQEVPKVGDDVVFSGYPLATPGMVTHRGMVSGFDATATLIFIEAPINKGNSGGALLNTQGHVIGIVSMREGGISQGLNQLSVQIDQTSSQGKITMLGVDPLQATKAIIQTLDQYISTGIGYARSIKAAREYLTKNTDVLK